MSQGSHMKEKEDQVPLLNTSEIGFNCLFSGLSLHKSGSSSRADLYSMCSTNVCFLSQCSLNASLKKTQTHPSPHIVTLCVCVCVLVRTFESYFLGKLQVYNLLLKTVIIVLYIRRPVEPINLLSESLINISPSPPPLPPPSPWQPPFNHLSGSFSLTF